MDTIPTQKSTPAILLGSLIAVVLAANFVPARWFGVEPVRQNYQKVDLSDLNSLDEIASDTDKDGVISWKEIINAAEGGTVDTQDQKPDPKVVAELNDPNNLTASFSKNLYLASAYLKKNGVTDAGAQQDVINQLIAQEAEKVAAKTYALKDLNIAKTESKESIKAYGNSVAEITKDIITEKTMEEDVSAITLYLESQEETVLLPLEQDYVRVKAKLDKLHALSVPLSAATYHIILMNRVSSYVDTLYNLSRASVDPLRSAVSLKNYLSSIVNTLRISTILSGYFSIQNIAFTAKDPGYIFTTGYTFK